MSISRRNFIKGGLAAAASLALAGPAIASAEETKVEKYSWDREADVVIVGAGGAGLGAACEASAAGANVLVLEVMMTQAMANTSLSAGMVQGGGTRFQAENGVTDDADQYEKLLEVLGDGYDEADLRHVYAQNVGETIDWLQEIGVEFGQLSEFGTVAPYYDSKVPSAPRMHWAASYSGQSITTPMFELAKSQGTEFEFNTEVKRLLVEDGAVVGVLAEQNEKELYVKANKGVLLSCGGFSRNVDMIKRFLSPQKAHGLPLLHSYGSAWQKGNGLTMAQAIGAKTTRVFLYGADVGIVLDAEKNTGSFPIRGNCALVSSDGLRHMTDNNGLWPTEFYMAELWAQENGLVWSVWNEETIAGVATGTTVDELVQKGLAFRADTLRELAEQINLDPDVFEQSIFDYNEEAADGSLTPVSTAPFVAASLCPVAPDTMGGIGINTDLQVINAFNEPIPGLYAAGVCAGGWRGQINPGCGTAVGWSVTSGRLAGRKIASL